MLTAPAPALPIISGTASGETRLGPCSNSVLSLALDRADPADPGPNDRAHVLGGVGEIAVPAGVGERFARRDEHKLREAIGATSLLDREVVGWLELARPALAVDDPYDAGRPALVKLLRPNAERRDGADARDDDLVHFSALGDHVATASPTVFDLGDVGRRSSSTPNCSSMI